MHSFAWAFAFRSATEFVVDFCLAVGSIVAFGFAVVGAIWSFRSSRVVYIIVRAIRSASAILVRKAFTRFDDIR